MAWIWWIVIGVAVILAVMLILICIAMTANRSETNCDRLRRMGERGAYNGKR